MLILHTHIFVTETQKQTVIVLALVETWQLSAYILRDFSKKKKKADKRKKKKEENKSILLSCIYESICLNIEKKKMYMLTNL